MRIIKKNKGAGLFICLAIFGTHAECLAADTTINTNETSTQGPIAPPLNGNDTLTIGPAGSIRVTGNDQPGVSGTGANNTVNNNGTIVTIGSSTGGGSGASGIITTGGSATINNTGLIETYGDGTNLGGGNCANNASGICAAGGSNTITNSGTINTSGDNARGIYANGGNNNIINTGSINSKISPGIGAIGGGNNITNTGTITTTGAGVEAVRASGNFNTITNSGGIISYSGNAITFAGTGNTLNLANTSYLAGNINLDTGTQINITTGANYSKLINYTGTLSGVSTSGPVPVFVNQATKKLATYDPTLFAASSDALGDMTGTISSLTPGRFNGTDKEHPLWARGFGMTASYAGSEATLARNYIYSGAAMGYDFTRSKSLILGVLGGYGQTSLTTNGTAMQSYNSSSDDGFLGLYGQKRWNNAWLDFALYGGVQVFNQQRYINDNLAYLGNASALASFSGSWLAPEAGVTIKVAEVSGWSLLPTARLRYAQQWMNGYTETGGSGANASVSGRNVTLGQSFVGVGTRKSVKTRVGKNTKMVLEGQIGYLYRGAVGDVSADVAMIGQSLSLPTEISSRNAVAASAGVAIDLSNSVALKIRGDAAAGGGMNYVAGGWAGLSAKF
jgi:uncharacterized protein with beta-barrel porin domain